MLFILVIMILVIVGYHIYLSLNKKSKTLKKEVIRPAYHTKKYKYWHRNRETSYRELLYCKKRYLHYKTQKNYPKRYKYWKKRYLSECKFFDNHYRGNHKVIA